MPNTLAHFGVQGFFGNRFLRWCDPKWILLGCVIPDVPWILQRVIRLFAIPIDVYDLRLYVICQASLLGCVMLAGAMSCLSAHPQKVFGVLTINALAHLILDSSQLKWANGVHLFAPFSWELWNLGWYWPESIVTYGMTVLGLGYLVFTWRVAIDQPLIPSMPSAKNVSLACLCLIAYFVFPFVVMNGPEQADNHFLQTLRKAEVRKGRLVEFDRVSYIKKESGAMIRTFSNEYLHVGSDPLPRSALVSIKGRFTSADSLEINDLHIHSSWFRDAASMVGLGLFGMLCIVSMMRGRSTMK